VVQGETAPIDSKTGLNPVSKPNVNADEDFTINKPLETVSDEDLNFDKTPEPKVDDTPKEDTAKKVETVAPAPARSTSGSLSETETKLNSKKDDLAKQAAELMKKRKKLMKCWPRLLILKKTGR